MSGEKFYEGENNGYLEGDLSDAAKEDERKMEFNWGVGGLGGEREGIWGQCLTIKRLEFWMSEKSR